MPDRILLEICAPSYPSALAAQEGGADRIELCTALPLGGLTPAFASIHLSRKRLDIPICVLIRPREGDFVYRPAEEELMLEDIRKCRKLGVAGVVTGALTPDFMPDTGMLARFVKAAGSMEVVFHRAFDYVRDPGEAMEQLISLGICRLLTSGQQTTAWEGRECIAALIRQSFGRITIMPGSGIRAANVVNLMRDTGARQVHLSATEYYKSPMNTADTMVRLNAGTAIPEFDYLETSEALVREVKAMMLSAAL